MLLYGERRETLRTLWPPLLSSLHPTPFTQDYFPFLVDVACGKFDKVPKNQQDGMHAQHHPLIRNLAATSRALAALRLRLRPPPSKPTPPHRTPPPHARPALSRCSRCRYQVLPRMLLSFSPCMLQFSARQLTCTRACPSQPLRGPAR